MYEVKNIWISQECAKSAVTHGNHCAGCPGRQESENGITAQVCTCHCHRRKTSAPPVRVVTADIKTDSLKNRVIGKIFGRKI